MLGIVGLCFLVGSPVVSVKAEAPVLDGKRIMFLGDSISQDGTYVSMIEYSIQKSFPGKTFDIVSIGLSSETVSGLSEKKHPFPRPCVHERLARALDKVKPALVVACYGMNDGIYHPQSPERLKAYQDGLLKLVADAKAAGAQVVLQTPPPFDPVPVEKKLLKDDAPDFSYMNPYFKYDAVLRDYSQWIVELKMPGVFCVDLNTPLTEYLKAQRVKTPAFCFSGDGIHPSKAGHLMMARAFLKAMGVAVPETDLEQELKTMLADPLFGLVDKHRRTRSAGWLDFVGYTRGGTVKKPSVEQAEKEAAALQEQIDVMRRKK